MNSWRGQNLEEVLRGHEELRKVKCLVLVLHFAEERSKNLKNFSVKPFYVDITGGDNPILITIKHVEDQSEHLGLPLLVELP